MTLAPFKAAIGGGRPGAPVASAQPEGLLVFSDRLPTIHQATELLIAEALDRARGNQSLAAGMLGISHQALSKRLQRRAEG